MSKSLKSIHLSGVESILETIILNFLILESNFFYYFDNFSVNFWKK